MRFTKEIKQKMREIAKTCEIQAKSLVFSLFLRQNIYFSELVCQHQDLIDLIPKNSEKYE